MIVGYYSRHGLAPDASVAQVEVPPELAVPVDYGMTVLTNSQDAERREAADRLAIYLMSPDAQALLAPYGFIPVTASSGQ